MLWIKNKIWDLGLIQEENIQNINQLFNQFIKYEEEVNNNINIGGDINNENNKKIMIKIL